MVISHYIVYNINWKEVVNEANHMACSRSANQTAVMKSEHIRRERIAVGWCPMSKFKL